MPQQIVFGIIRALHDLFTAMWIGGLLTTALSFMPVFKESRDKIKGLVVLLDGYQRKLANYVLISIVGLWITGLLLSKQSPAYSGFMNFSTTSNALLSIKHILIFVMIIIGLYRRFVLGSKLKSFSERKLKSFSEQQQKTYGILLMVNALLGVVVLFLSGIGASFSQGVLLSIR